jgi:selenocysteine lyase/cysteine desulfurase
VAAAGEFASPQLGDRSWFPTLKWRSYLHHGAIAPVSLPVQAAVQRVLARYAEAGAGAFPEFQTQRAELRGLLEQLIGAEPGSVALQPNTSRGVTDVALCLPWQQGDRVVVLKGEFPTNVTPWQRAAELFGLRLSWHDARAFLEQPEQALAALEADLAAGVRLLAVSAVQFQTGLRMPLEELGAACARHGAELFVDAIQAVGAVPIDVRTQNISYLACGGHKWLMGMEGAGFGYVAPAAAARLRPHVAAWMSHEQAEEFLFAGGGSVRYDKPLKHSALMFESGTLNLPGFAALHASVPALLRLGVQSIFAHINAFHDALEPQLLERGFHSLRSPHATGRSAIFSVLPPHGVDVGAVQRGLFARGILCGTPEGVLRFSPHWPNALAEVNDVVLALDECLSAG